MFTRSISFVVACFVMAPAVLGQTGQAASGQPTAADRQWIARRAKFICDVYGLQGKRAERVTAMMIERVGAQRGREADTAMTIHSLSGALRQLPNEPISEALRSTLRRKFQRQMYDIYREAPLSYANILRRVEADLSKAQIAAAHERLKQQVSGRLAALGVEFSIQNLDRLRHEAVELPSRAAAPQAQPRPLPIAKPSVPKQLPTVPRPASPPADKLAGNVSNRRPPPPPPIPTPVAKPIEPSPPVGEWAGRVDAVIAKYAFTLGQKTQAKAILDQTRPRAEKHLKDKKADYAKAEKTADKATRAGRLRTLNRPVDRMFYQLIHRVESLATQEQVQKAEAKAGGSDKSTAKADGKKDQ
ncbi:MAG: hypothetical protein ACE5F9_01310 [Phycisphaerae bacterium]